MGSSGGDRFAGRASSVDGEDGAGASEGGSGAAHSGSTRTGSRGGLAGEAVEEGDGAPIPSGNKDVKEDERPPPAAFANSKPHFLHCVRPA